MAKNEVASVTAFQVAQLDTEFMATIHEEMEGLGEIPMDVIKVPSGGGIAFEVPGEDGSADMAKEIVGIILSHHPQNSYWMGNYTGGNESPDCASNDGITGTNTTTGKVTKCAECPMNEYGTAAVGNGKACKNQHKVYILQENAILPAILSIPPTSIKAFRDYVGKRLLLRGKKPADVITKVSLTKATSSTNLSYSQCVFTKVADLDDATKAALAPMADMVKAIAQKNKTAKVELKEATGSAPCAEAEAVFQDAPPPTDNDVFAQPDFEDLAPKAPF